MDIVISFTAKVAEYTVEPIGRQAGYLLSYKGNFKELADHVKNLEAARERLNHQVEEERRNGREVERDVVNWLKEVTKAIEIANRLQKDRRRAKVGRSTWSLFPNLSLRHRLSRDATKIVKDVVEVWEKGNFDQIGYLPPLLDGVTFSISSATRGGEKLKERESFKEGVVKALIDPNSRNIGVYGLGGVGKTTLVKEVAQIAKQDILFDKVVIAHVSQTPDIKTIQGEIADLLGLRFLEETVAGRAERLRQRIKAEKSILVILDDIWTRLDLEKVGIPYGNDHNWCKLLMTSRNQDVLQQMDAQKDFTFRLELLSEAEAWSLFQSMVGDVVRDNNLKAVATQVAQKCAGLPLCLVTVARSLRNKEDVKPWKDALRQLENNDHDGLDAINYSALELSYDNLEKNGCLPPFLDGVDFFISSATRGGEKPKERESFKEGVVKALKDPNSRNIGVYGLGGVGKTTLVKEVAQIAKQDILFDKVVIAHVSQTPDIKTIQGEIADLLGLRFLEETVAGRAERLRQRIKAEKSILVILDDIWTRLDLEKVGIPYGNDHNWCKLLMTSRNQDVLQQMDAQKDFTFRLELLSEAEAWSLFQSMVGDVVRDNNLKAVATQVAQKCAGLPLCLVTVARSLRNKEDVKPWKDALRQLENNDHDGLDAINYSALELSYDNLEKNGCLPPFLDGVDFFISSATRGGEKPKERESFKEGVVKALKDPNSRNIGVYGLGGVGKTTLVKEVAQIAKQDILFDKVVIAIVSKTPNIKIIQLQIADLLDLRFWEETVAGRAEHLRQRIKAENTILVILDDIWTRLDLEKVGIPYGNDHKGCKLLMTSRNQDVLQQMDAQKDFTFRLELLSEAEAWSLFQSMAGDVVKDNNLKAVATQVAQKCAGLPLRLVTVARALRNKSDDKPWKDALRQLENNDHVGMDAITYSALGLSYNSLENDEMKPIFLPFATQGCTSGKLQLVRNAAIEDFPKRCPQIILDECHTPKPSQRLYRPNFKHLIVSS